LTNSSTDGGPTTFLRHAVAGILLGALTVLGPGAPDTGEAWAAEPENTLLMDLDDGRVVIEMRPDLAPRHVARIKELVRQGFYDGLAFHRVIGGSMAQTGDPKGDGTGGSGVNIEAELSSEPHVRGTVSMARGEHPDSADSQFFIVFARSREFDGRYTIWGRVTDGMGHVGKIKRGDKARDGAVDDPDRIVRLRVAADVEN
jgi:peptidylprolyl isomerase